MGIVKRISSTSTSRRGKWVVIAVWLVILFISAPLAGKLQGAEKNDAGSYLPKSAESTQVLNLQKNFPDANVLDAVVIYDRSTGLTASDTQSIAAQQAAAIEVPGVRGQVSPVISSKDGQAAQFVVPINASDTKPFVASVKALRAQLHVTPGLTVHLSGPAGVQSDSNDVFTNIDGKLLYATILVVVVVLLCTYRSPVLWLIPVIGAAAALESAQAAVYGLAKAGLTVNGLSAGILLVLVFGAGTDYALLLIARYREELHNHEDKHEAMTFALHRAGPAILASSTTVVLSLLCLLVCQLQSTRGLGPVGAVGIVCSLAAMTTLLPALLVAVPRGVFWPFVPRFGAASHGAGPWARIADAVSGRSRLIWVTGLVILGVLCAGLVGLHANGLSDKSQFVGKPDSIKGESVLAAHFGGDDAAPAVVVAKVAAGPQIVKIAAAMPGIASVSSFSSGGYVEVDAALKDAADSAAAEQTVRALRQAVHPIPDADALVGGTTAITHDTEKAAARDNLVVIPIVLVLVLLILILLLRAVIAPLLLIASVVLSYFAALGASSFAWHHIFGFHQADASTPLYLFIFLVALGIDYNIFLMSRVREESLQLGTREGIRKGVAVTGGVITSAGVVLAATFSVLAVLPLVTLVEIGSAVAFGVVLDTFLIRSVLVPAVALDIGPRIWWPSALARKSDEPVVASTASK